MEAGMSDELVQRLRGLTLSYEKCHEAAAEIERLRAEVAGWVEQHGRDSAELRHLCEARDEARSALAALRKRVDEAPVGCVSLIDGPECSVWAEMHAETRFDGLNQKRVALVVLEK
jgi:hypothetical protein